MEENKRKDIALMKYSAIAPVINGLDERYPSLDAYYNAASVKGITAPDGTLKHYSPSTIESWRLDYIKGGFDALLPKCRSDAGIPRKLDDDLKEHIRYFKEHYPRMTAAAIYRQLKDDGSIAEGDDIIQDRTCFALASELIISQDIYLLSQKVELSVKVFYLP